MPPPTDRNPTPERRHERRAGPGLVLVMVAAGTWGTTGATMALLARRSPLGPLAVGFFRLGVALFRESLGVAGLAAAALLLAAVTLLLLGSRPSRETPQALIPGATVLPSAPRGRDGQIGLGFALRKS